MEKSNFFTIPQVPPDLRNRFLIGMQGVSGLSIDALFKKEFGAAQIAKFEKDGEVPLEWQDYLLKKDGGVAGGETFLKRYIFSTTSSPLTASTASPYFAQAQKEKSPKTNRSIKTTDQSKQSSAAEQSIGSSKKRSTRQSGQKEQHPPDRPTIPEKLTPSPETAPIEVKKMKYVNFSETNDYEVLKVGNNKLFLLTPTNKMVIAKIEKGLSLPDTNILLRGETGVGKTWQAQAGVKNFDKLKKFVDSRISCLSLELIASELFGHAKGSFTGATSDKIGLVERAQNGILFLDEIGYLPISVQIMLLKLFEQGVYCRVGESTERKFNGQIISSTNQNLELMIKEKTFLSDLYYRIGGYEIIVPPLRERKKEIAEFADFILNQLNQTYNSPIEKSLDRNFQEYLFIYDWPGNLRELENKIKTAFLDSKSPLLSVELTEEQSESIYNSLPDDDPNPGEQPQQEASIDYQITTPDLKLKDYRACIEKQRSDCEIQTRSMNETRPHNTKPERQNKVGCIVKFAPRKKTSCNLATKPQPETSKTSLPQWVLNTSDEEIRQLMELSFQRCGPDLAKVAADIKVRPEQLRSMELVYRPDWRSPEPNQVEKKKKEEATDQKQTIIKALMANNGIIKLAAQALGVHTNTLSRQIKNLGIDLKNLPEGVGDSSDTEVRKCISKQAIIRTLVESGGVKAKAAEALGVSVLNLGSWLKIFGIVDTDWQSAPPQFDDSSMTNSNIPETKLKKKISKQAIISALVENGGVKTKAAQVLGISVMTLDDRLKRFELTEVDWHMTARLLRESKL